MGKRRGEFEEDDFFEVIKIQRNQNKDGIMKNFTKIFLSLLFVIVINFSSQAEIYEVHSDAEMSEIPWLTLSSGDEVHIHWKEEPYRVKIGLRCRGTEEQRVIIKGITNGEGELPVWSGEDAITPEQFDEYNGGDGFFSTEYDEFLGLILIKPGDIDDWGYKPGFITIENLKIMGANENNTYTAMNDSVYSYNPFASGIHVLLVEDFKVRGCELTDNGEGLFIVSRGGEELTSRKILIERNRIYGNGVVNSYGMHNVYTEAGDITYQYNYIGQVREGSEGSSLKDRSAGLIVRYNWIVSSARALDIIEAEEGHNPLYYEPNYHETYIYGNIIVNDIDSPIHSTSLIHYGYDNVPEDARLGPHYFYNNTVVMTGTEPGGWRLNMFEGGTDWGDTTTLADNLITINLYNNIFYWNPAIKQGDFNLGTSFGTINLEGTNWISEDWQEGTVEGWRYWYGIVNRNGKLIEGAYPGFNDESSRDFTLMESSPAVDSAETLPDTITSDHPVLAMYKSIADSTLRTIIGSAMDLGAFEYGISSIEITEEDLDNIFYLRQNQPNPLCNKTVISYQLTAAGHTKLTIYDKLGREIKILVDEYQTAEPHTQKWDGTDKKGVKVPSGTYFYQIRLENGKTSSKKMIFIK